MSTETITKTISIPVSFSAESDGTTHVSDRFSHVLRNGGASDESVVVFEYEFASNNAKETLLGTSSVNAITKVELEFWSIKADDVQPIKEVEFVPLANQPSMSSAATIFSDVNLPTGTDIWLTNSIRSTTKTKHVVTLGEDSSSGACDWFKSNLPNDWWAVGLRRREYTGADDVEGESQIGGVYLNSGTETGWEDRGNGIPAAPRFIVTYQITLDSTNVSQQEMRYTTSDPTSSQLTPENSLGGHASPNEVYVKGQISEFLGSTQTTVSLSDESLIPFSSGLASIGPEVMRFSSIDQSTKKLLGVVRGVSPEASFPSNLHPYREYVYFLDTSKIFNNRPTSGLEQYRCVAFRHNGYNIQNVNFYLRQSSNSPVQIDAGLEIPEYSTRIGAINSSMSATNVMDSKSTEILEAARGLGTLLPSGSDLFEGGYVTLDYDEVYGSSKLAQIESFDVNDAQDTATFILDQQFTYSTPMNFRIESGPSQTILNDVARPVSNSTRFLGFFDEGGSGNPNYYSNRDGSDLFVTGDVVYLWIKRSLVRNTTKTDDTGAVIYIEFDASLK